MFVYKCIDTIIARYILFYPLKQIKASLMFLCRTMKWLYVDVFFHSVGEENGKKTAQFTK
jgi:hypothetical protein